jgi:hypothetical protein
MFIALLFMAAAGCSKGAPAGESDERNVTAFVVEEGENAAVSGEMNVGRAGAAAARDAHGEPGVPKEPPAAVTGGPAGEKQPSGIPIENQVKGNPPGFLSAQAGAKKLLEAIRADDPSAASSFFFPSAPFDLLKNMVTPGTYYKKLVKWYAEDIHTEHLRYAGVGNLEFDGFEAGRCKWMEPCTEGNKLPYWACRYNSFYGRAGSTRRRFELRVMINWGKSWYVTHLGAVRK